MPHIAACVMRFLPPRGCTCFRRYPLGAVCLLRVLPRIAACVLRFLPHIAACVSGGTLQTPLYINYMNTCSHACSHVHTLCSVQWRQLARTHVAKKQPKARKLQLSIPIIIIIPFFFHSSIIGKQGVGACDEQRTWALRACCIGCRTLLLLLPVVRHGPLQCLCLRQNCLRRSGS